MAGAALLPRLRARLSPDALLAAGSIGLAVVTLLLGLRPPDRGGRGRAVVGGACWILALSTLNSLYQLSLPQWIKARGHVVLPGGLPGRQRDRQRRDGRDRQPRRAVAHPAIAAAGLALGPLAGLRWRFRPIPPGGACCRRRLAAPQLATGETPEGPVLVTSSTGRWPGTRTSCWPPCEDHRFSRRRTGATSWRAWQDGAEPGRILEQFVVASWDEHLRQHERVTKRDQANGWTGSAR